MRQTANIYVTPYDAESDSGVVHDAEMRVIEYPSGILEVHDPLFAEPYRFGDQSLVTDKIADQYIVESWRHNLVQMSVRQLSNTETYETKRGTGRWSRGQHMLSSAAMTAMHGGSAVEIMQMQTHDAAHVVGSHQTDDLLGPRGQENAHDMRLQTTMMRNGFVRRLTDRGLIDEAGNFYGLDQVHINDILDLSKLPHGSINWPGTFGFLEEERAQYIAHEGAIWGFGPAVMREATSHLGRIPDSPHGDHLVFDDIDAAVIFETTQIRCYTEHWSDVSNDLIDELLINAHRAMFTIHDPALSTINRYHAADALNTLEEDWQQLRQQVAERHPFMAVMLKLAHQLAAHQRDVHDYFDAYNNKYSGPILPDWIQLQESIVPPLSSMQRIVHGRHKNIRGNTIVLEMQPGKARAINPWVKLPGKEMQRVEDLVPWLEEYRLGQSRWCGLSYDAIIDLDHPALRLSKAEKRSVERNLRRIEAAWSATLNRPDMPDDILTEQVRQAGERYRIIGHLGIQHEDSFAQKAS